MKNFENVTVSEKKEKFSVERLLQSQAEALPERLNEDALIVLEDEEKLVAAVVDGATATSSVTGVGERKSDLGGRFAAQAVIEGIKRGFNDGMASAKDLLLNANREIAKKLFEQGIDVDKTSPLNLSRASGTLVVIDKANNLLEISQAGDVAGLFITKDGKVTLSLSLDSDIYDKQTIALAQTISAREKTTLKEALKRHEINELMEKSQLVNNDLKGKGSGVLNGSSHLEKYIKTRKLSLKNIKQVILLTDGMWLPTEEFDIEPDWKKIVNVINKKGLSGLYQKVLELKNADPDLKQYPRWKKHDDATGVVININ